MQPKPPLNGYKLIMLLPMFGGGYIRHYYAVVDRGDDASGTDRWVVVNVNDPSDPTWNWAYEYCSTVDRAVRLCYKAAGAPLMPWEEICNV